MKFDSADIGTLLLETITQGLYDGNPNCLREYVQNSIDEKPNCIEIYYENGKNNLVIKDDGTGMDKDDLKFALGIGRSKKTGEQVGWRGIGIWSGSSNCSRIIIITKKKNSKKLRIKIDNEVIRKGIETRKPMLQTLESATSEIEELELGKDESFENTQFTIVRLESILPTQKWIFDNEEEIKNYLQQTLPLPFEENNFTFSKEINKWLKQNGVVFSSVCVKFNGEELFRPPFRSDIFFDKIIYKDFKINNKLVAAGWVLTHNMNRVLQKPNKGIFFKIKGFTIGDENLTRHQHTGTYNPWQYGEIHIVSKEIRENAPRNNFEYNTEVIKDLLKQVGDFVGNLQLQNQYQSDRIVSSKIKKVEKLIAKGDIASAKKELNTAKGRFERARSFPKETSLEGIKSLIDAQTIKDKKEIGKLEEKLQASSSQQPTSKELLNVLIKNMSTDIKKSIKIVNGQIKPVSNITDPIKELLNKKIGTKENEFSILTKLAFGWEKVNGGAPKLVIEKDKQRMYRNYNFGVLSYAVHDMFVNLYKHKQGGDSFKWFESLSGDEQNQIFIEMLAIISWVRRIIEHAEPYQP